MTKETNNSTEEKILQERKTYLTPKLHHYGGLAELTHAGTGGGNDGGGGGGDNNSRAGGS